jgi:1,4-dihydroxy-2-naphthoate octaprenyltransferase
MNNRYLKQSQTIGARISDLDLVLNLHHFCYVRENNKNSRQSTAIGYLNVKNGVDVYHFLKYISIAIYSVFFLLNSIKLLYLNLIKLC